MRSKTYKSLLVLVATLSLNLTAHAFQPESGWWWNSSESGRGANIEIQNDIVFMSMYVYTDSGEPIFYTASGPMEGDNKFTGKLKKTSGGQCLGCNYQSPSSKDVGTISIKFDNPYKATLNISGSPTIKLERFGFDINRKSPTFTLGEWILVEGSRILPIYFGERISLSTTTKTSDGTTIATGNRSHAPSRMAIAEADGDTVYMLLDSSASYYTFYALNINGLNSMEGRSWTFLKSSELTGSGLPVLAMRTASEKLVATGFGPGHIVEKIVTKEETNKAISTDMEPLNRIRSDATSIPLKSHIDDGGDDNLTDIRNIAEILMADLAEIENN